MKSIRLFSKFVIKNTKICINCTNYVPLKYIDPYDELYETSLDFNQRLILGTCSKFGDQNLVSGLIEYKSASVCRTNQHLCGKIGQYYNEIKHDN